MMNDYVAVVDYGMGNIWSVISAINYLGGEADLVSNPQEIAESDYIILPGVGSFRKAMQVLKMKGIDKAINSAVHENQSKILGICLGMQLLGSSSTEDGETEGLGLVPNRIEHFTDEELLDNKVPHVGFNAVHFSDQTGLFKDLAEYSDFYFTHSYRMLDEDNAGRIATCSYGVDFLAAFEVDNICGAQFHPEKSQANGLKMIRNFLDKE